MTIGELIEEVKGTMAKLNAMAHECDDLDSDDKEDFFWRLNDARADLESFLECTTESEWEKAVSEAEYREER